MYPGSCEIGEGRAEIIRAWGAGLEQEGGGGSGGATQSVRGNYISFIGTNLLVVDSMHQFIINVS